MELFNGWMSNLIIFLLAAFLLEILLPSSSLQKYARLVLSFILMLLIIEPLVAWNNKGSMEWEQQWERLSPFTVQEQKLETEINNKKNEIVDGQDAYISKQVREQLEEQVERTLIERWGWEVDEIRMNQINERGNSAEDIKVDLLLKKHEQDERTENTKTKIEPVHIQLDDDQEHVNSNAHLQDKREIEEYLEEEWGLQDGQLQIQMTEEGG
ncbi:stage III sporulation protein AF [Bacillus piscicola]|uniref:stage III sporulation protein AF n=1 Tax=Bacillus piscicola TaxID=1632684 RepID=UPI001F08E6ED